MKEKYKDCQIQNELLKKDLNNLLEEYNKVIT